MSIARGGTDRRAPDPAALDRWRAVPVAVAADLGGEIALVDPAIRPLCPPGRQPRLFGRAATARCPPRDFGAVLAALETIGPGEVLVIDAGGAAECAMIGEILCTHLRRLGAAGVVCDGAVRDVATLAGWADLPVFARHVTARGPMTAQGGETGGAVTIGGAQVAPGDLILGDDDGVVVLPPSAVAARIAEAEAKLVLEADWGARLAAGVSVAEVFGLRPG